MASGLRGARRSDPPGRRIRPQPAFTDPAPLTPPSPARVAIVLASCALLAVYGAAESLLWPRTLWGAHAYAFLPPATLVVGLTLVAVALTPWAARALAWLDARVTARGRWWPWIVAALAAMVFWLARERHLFSGDALPLSIRIPQGQRFHHDEPLTMYLHHLLYRWGGGRWSGATAVAIGSVAAGAFSVGWAAHWFARRAGTPVAAALAVVAFVFQGYGQLYFGHVEDYSYLAAALLVFFTTGIDFLERRGGLAPPLLAALMAFAFHVLGGLLLVPLVVLVTAGIADPTRRARTLILSALAIALVTVAGVWINARLGAQSPLVWFRAEILNALTNPDGMHASRFFSAAHVRDLWSEWQLVGPLALLLVVLLTALHGARFARTWTGAFLLVGAAVLMAPSIVKGEGNLGPARDWDLFAAPAIAPALAALVLVMASLERTQARRVLLAVAALSLFHTLPWVAVNASESRATARMLALPLGRGRNQMMLGTHYLNAGDLSLAEKWYRLALAADPDNANSQSGLGVALARQDRLREAEGPMVAAVTLRPNVALYRIDLANLRMAFGQWPQAAAEWKAATTLDPGNALAWRGLSVSLLQAGDARGALAAAAEGLRRAPGDEALETAEADAYDRQVALLGAAGRYDEARTVLTAFAARHPRDPRVSVLQTALAR